MKIAFTILIGIVLIFIGIRVVSFWDEQQGLKQSMSDMESRLVAAKQQEADLQAQMKYLGNPANLEKELRAQFNYKKPGETMMIIVPSGTSTTATSTR